MSKLCDLRDTADSICSVSWSNRGSYLAVGTNRGGVQIWDPVHLRLVRSLTGHTARVGCMDWGAQVLSTGERWAAGLQPRWVVGWVGGWVGR